MDTYPSTARMLMMARSQAKSVAAAGYEPLLYFSSTPVYDVALAEDITDVKSTSPYIIPLNSADNIQKVLMLIMLPEVAAQDYYRASFFFDNDSLKKVQSNFSYGTTQRQVIIEAENNSGIAQSFYMIGNVGAYSSISKSMYYSSMYSPVFLSPSSKITEVQIYGSSGGANMYTLKAGTRITIYVAKEAH